ncbi:MAG: hypothetical protein H0V96_12615 [Acidimicrobiia bacterium]|nr:hypothetical protein [Acidimicrobiia bacterium]
MINTVMLLSGVFNRAGGSYKVAQDTGSNMQVRVGSGANFDSAAVASSIAGQGVYLVEHQNATHALTIGASHASLPRYDKIVLRIYDDSADSSGKSYAELERIAGTPAASPVIPATPASSLALATVLVNPNVTAITNANISNIAPEAPSRQAPRIQFSTLTDRSTTTNDAAMTQWGTADTIGNVSTNLVAGSPVTIGASVNYEVGIGAAVPLTRMSVRVDIAVDGTWNLGPVYSTDLNSTGGSDIDVQSGSAAYHLENVTPAISVQVRVMTQRTVSTSGTATFRAGRVRSEILPPT